MMMMGDENGQVTVPPGFRFHPTDEELLYYYLRKKVCCEAIDLDVIREVDLNKLEPWDLKEKCKIGSGPQNEWYFFSHKDKKYPTGTRTNRATTAGFWKATGRDKPIHLTNSHHRIGMRKTLVFYTGRAPHGHKTDWIMHEYRLEDHNNNNNNNNINTVDVQEDGWVVCRVFMKKNQHNIMRGFQTTEGGGYSSTAYNHQEQQIAQTSTTTVSSTPSAPGLEPKLNNSYYYANDCSIDHIGSMHLPPLLSPESAVCNFLNNNMATDIIECSHNLLRLTSVAGGHGIGGDWSFLDKLLASHPTSTNASSQAMDPPAPSQRFPFHYLGYHGDTTTPKYSK